MHNSRRMFRGDEPEEQAKIPPRARLLLNLVGSREYDALKEIAAEYGSGHSAPIPGTLQDGFRYVVSKIVGDTLNQLFLLIEQEADLARRAMEE